MSDLLNDTPRWLPQTPGGIRILDSAHAEATVDPPHQPGVKFDAGKAPVRRGLLEYFPRACLAVAEVSQHGATKYTWNGWETVPNGIDRYGDAELRHVCLAAIDGPLDRDSSLTHAAHEAWNALARLELLLRQG